MSTLVCLHAHPDDESSQTSGLMARAVDAGHTAYAITATDGSLGEVHIELAPGETLAERRRSELADALQIIGAQPPIMLGYQDSGMEGEPSNDDPAAFCQADVEVVAQRVAQILTDLDADVLTIYDDHGGYGHPDHIQVHKVGLRAAEIAGIEHVYEATMNRDRMAAMTAEIPDPEGFETPDPEFMQRLGTAQRDISYVVDASNYADVKRKALRAYTSQIPSDSFFLAMPDDVFVASFGYEHYNVPGVRNTGGPTEVDLLPGL